LPACHRIRKDFGLGNSGRGHAAEGGEAVGQGRSGRDTRVPCMYQERGTVHEQVSATHERMVRARERKQRRWEE
jgi:hypothetical protein